MRSYIYLKATFSMVLIIVSWRWVLLSDGRKPTLQMNIYVCLYFLQYPSLNENKVYILHIVG